MGQNRPIFRPFPCIRPHTVPHCATLCKTATAHPAAHCAREGVEVYIYFPPVCTVRRTHPARPRTVPTSRLHPACRRTTDSRTAGREDRRTEDNRKFWAGSSANRLRASPFAVRPALVARSCRRRRHRVRARQRSSPGAWSSMPNPPPPAAGRTQDIVSGRAGEGCTMRTHGATGRAGGRVGNRGERRTSAAGPRWRVQAGAREIFFTTPPAPTPLGLHWYLPRRAAGLLPEKTRAVRRVPEYRGARPLRTPRAARENCPNLSFLA